MLKLRHIAANQAAHKSFTLCHAIYDMNLWPHECDKQHALLCQRNMNDTILDEVIYMWIFMINNINININNMLH